MLGKHADLLKSLVAAATTWRTQALAQGVELTQVNAVMPDGKPVTLFYAVEQVDWHVDT